MSYTRDWTAATRLSPWVKVYGVDYDLLSGLVFDGDRTLVNKPGGVYADGTTIVYFDVAGSTAADTSMQRFEVSTWAYGAEWLCGGLRTQVYSGDINLWFGFSKVNSVTGSRQFIGVPTYADSYSTEQSGTLLMWHSSGTWYLAAEYESTDLGTISYANSDFNPSVGSICPTAHCGELLNGDSHLTITSGTYSVTQAAAPVDRYFWYAGYYNNGSNDGEKDLTATLLEMSPIQQYLYMPSEDGIFSATVNVTLKNDTNQWGTFTGHAVSGTSYTPKGVFYVRDAEVDSGNETLFAGFIDYKSISVDALNQTVSFTLDSVMNGLLDKAIVTPHTINREDADVQSWFGVIHPENLGTIASIERNAESEGGTIAVYPNELPLGATLKANELLSINTTHLDDYGLFRVGEYLDDADGTCTFAVDKVPDWIQAGDYLVRNRAYPEEIGGEGINGLQFYNSFLMWPAYFLNKAHLDCWGGVNLNWSIATTAMQTALQSVIISPSMYIYGDEKFIDVLDDFLLALGGGGCSSYDGETVNFFVPSPTYLLQSAAGTLSFNTDIYGAYVASKQTPLKSVSIDYAYSYEKRRFLENVRIDTDFGYGDDKAISTWLINFNEDARNLAFFTSAFFSSGAVLQTLTDTSHWSEQRPGNIIQITDIPEDFETNGSNFLVTSRAFDPKTKLVTSMLTEVSLEAADFFRVGVHNIGGSTGVL